MANQKIADQEPNEIIEDVPVMRTVECPQCKNIVPNSLFCISCEYPLHTIEEVSETDDESEKGTNESANVLEVMLKGNESDNSTEDENYSYDAAGMAQRPELDKSILELNREMVNCVSLKLWSIDQLLEEKIDESQFNQLFEGYNARHQQLTDRRNEMLKHARDIDAYEELLKKVKISLDELEMRKSLDDLFEGEYEAKGPAFRWEIQHYQEKVSARKMEISYLKDLTNTISPEILSEMKETTQRLLHTLDNLEIVEYVSSETIENLRRSLEDIITLFKTE
jgi:hypothetical protein